MPLLAFVALWWNLDSLNVEYTYIHRKSIRTNSGGMWSAAHFVCFCFNLGRLLRLMCEMEWTAVEPSDHLFRQLDEYECVSGLFRHFTWNGRRPAGSRYSPTQSPKSQQFVAGLDFLRRRRRRRWPRNPFWRCTRWPIDSAQFPRNDAAGIKCCGNVSQQYADSREPTKRNSHHVSRLRYQRQRSYGQSASRARTADAESFREPRAARSTSSSSEHSAESLTFHLV